MADLPRLRGCLSRENEKNGKIAVVFCGDGASNQGPLRSHELGLGLETSGSFRLENNGYGEATGSSYSVSCGDIADRAKGFGMPGRIADGHDFFEVYEAFGEASERARKGEALPF